MECDFHNKYFSCIDMEGKASIFTVEHKIAELMEDESDSEDPFVHMERGNKVKIIEF